MRLEPDGTVVLSRRNVAALLAKADDPGSARTLVGGSDAPGLVVRVEPDDEHYGREGRLCPVPGPVHPRHAQLCHHDLTVSGSCDCEGGE